MWATIHRHVREDNYTMEQHAVQCYNFNRLLQQYGFAEINYLAIDVEGAELEVISSIDFTRV